MDTLETRNRPMWKNILVVTDLSFAAECAISLALDMRRRYDSTLYAVRLVPSDFHAVIVSEKEIFSEDRKRRLEDMLCRVPHRVVVQQEEAWPTLSQMIRENEIGLLIAGTAGRTDGSDGLGSMAEEILRQAPCPLLIAGPNVSSAAKHAPDLKRILYATDFSFESLAAVPVALSLVREYRAELVLLHASGNAQSNHLSLAVHTLAELIPLGVELPSQPICLVEQGGPAEVVLKVSAKEKIDLLVLGLPNAAVCRIAAQADCPVLTVRG